MKNDKFFGLLNLNVFPTLVVLFQDKVLLYVQGGTRLTQPLRPRRRRLAGPWWWAKIISARLLIPAQS
jgi:hypothetical protein